MLKQVGKYQILEKVGAGGFGAVYKGRDPFIKRTVAIKTCQSDEEEIRKRFFREAEYAGNLQHKNITTIFDFGVAEDGLPYIVQEFLTGEDLDRRIKRRESTPLVEQLRILADVCDGLEHAHAAGIVHRDIKPGNIRILDDGTVKIMDFGIAKSMMSESSLTQTGITLGTASYLAPEQIRGERVSPRTDIFSFGVMAYEFLTFQRPFTGDQIAAVLHKILNEMPPAPSSLGPNIPAAVDELVLATLAKDPEHRPHSCLEIRERLHEIIRETSGSQLLSTGSIPQPSPRFEGTGRAYTSQSARSSSVSPEPSAGKAGKPAKTGLETSQLLREHMAEGQPARSPANVPLSRAGERTPAISPGPGPVPVEPEERGGAVKILIAAVVILAIGIGIAYFVFLRTPPPTVVPEGPITSVPTAVPAPTSLPAAQTPEPAATAMPTPVAAGHTPTAAPVATTGDVFLRPSHFSDVAVDGVSRGGVSPKGLKVTKLNPGKHTATFSIKGFMSLEREFEVKAGKVTEVTAEFPGRGQLVVSVSNPDVSGAEVWIDGKREGKAPFSKVIPAGAHRVEVKADGYLTEGRAIELPEDDRVKVEVTLKKNQ